MLKDILKRAVAEAIHGDAYGRSKPWKKGERHRYDRDRDRGDDRWYDDRRYRDDGLRGRDHGYGHGDGYRHGRHGGGLKGMLINALTSWLSRRR